MEAVEPPKEGKSVGDQAATLRAYYPELADVSNEKLLAAADLAWRFGLDPTGVGGFCRLALKGQNLGLVLGYRGVVSLAMSSGAFAVFEARVVYDRDTFALDYGSQILKHAPFAEDGDSGPIVGAYAVSIDRSGSRSLEYLPGRQIVALPTIGLPGAAEAAKRHAVVALAANSPVDMVSLRYALEAERRSLEGLAIP